LNSEGRDGMGGREGGVGREERVGMGRGGEEWGREG